MGLDLIRTRSVLQILFASIGILPYQETNKGLHHHKLVRRWTLFLPRYQYQLPQLLRYKSDEAEFLHRNVVLLEYVPMECEYQCGLNTTID